MKKQLVNLICAFIPNKTKRHNFRKKYIEKENNTTINNREIQFSLLNLSNKIKNYDNIKINNKNKFLLFKYAYQKYIKSSYTSGVNLGDYVQTIAVKNALDTIFNNNEYDFFDRDNLTNYYGENIITIMQGWFSHSYNFIPNDRILPIFIGTHFTMPTQEFLKQFLIYNYQYFVNKEIGCRDLHTLNFCQKHGIKAYFSRCLTLTLPKRAKSDSQNKVFITNVPKTLLTYIPNNIKDDAEYIQQRDVGNNENDFTNNWQKYYKNMENLLNRYKNEAKLVITTALHCAAPCLAMGIPVILLTDSEEQKTRFSALNGLIKINTLDNLKNNLINYNFEAPDIEELKGYILKNLELSIKKELGETIDNKQLEDIRNKIANFKIIYEAKKEYVIKNPIITLGKKILNIHNLWKIE